MFCQINELCRLFDPPERRLECCLRFTEKRNDSTVMISILFLIEQLNARTCYRLKDLIKFLLISPLTEIRDTLNNLLEYKTLANGIRTKNSVNVGDSYKLRKGWVVYSTLWFLEAEF